MTGKQHCCCTATLLEKDELPLASGDATVDEEELPADPPLPVVEEEPTLIVEETLDFDEALKARKHPQH